MIKVALGESWAVCVDGEWVDGTPRLLEGLRVLRQHGLKPWGYFPTPEAYEAALAVEWLGVAVVEETAPVAPTSSDDSVVY